MECGVDCTIGIELQTVRWMSDRYLRIFLEYDEDASGTIPIR